ncbi:hypothetical protein [Salipaludibacillus keqinensis]|nr:hypothetical protein [Salipaludibacillus keqinensis]
MVWIALLVASFALLLVGQTETKLKKMEQKIAALEEKQVKRKE